MNKPFVQVKKDSGLVFVAMDEHTAAVVQGVVGSVIGDSETTTRMYTDAFYYALESCNEDAYAKYGINATDGHLVAKEIIGARRVRATPDASTA